MAAAMLDLDCLPVSEPLIGEENPVSATVVKFSVLFKHICNWYNKYVINKYAFKGPSIALST